MSPDATYIAFFGGTPGGPELLIIMFVVLLLFGGKKLPGLARSLGRSLSEFKRGKTEGEIAVKSSVEDALSEEDTIVEEA